MCGGGGRGRGLGAGGGDRGGRETWYCLFAFICPDIHLLSLSNTMCGDTCKNGSIRKNVHFHIEKHMQNPGYSNAVKALAMSIQMFCQDIDTHHLMDFEQAIRGSFLWKVNFKNQFPPKNEYDHIWLELYSSK